MEDEFTLVTELAHAFDTDPDAVIAAALERQVPLIEVAAAYARTLRHMRIHGVQATGLADATEPDARPPGVFDPRIVLQSDVWIDILRRRHIVSEMPPAYAGNVIEHLHKRIHDIVEVVGGAGDPHAWLDQTPLVEALRLRSSSVGDS